MLILTLERDLMMLLERASLSQLVRRDVVYERRDRENCSNFCTDHIYTGQEQSRHR